ncbi:hypothetical protein, partial [Lactobacillus sp. MRS-253-APC-2B]|uniref:hypothetical protein n=1 Tax=Lactobacillus sp. MRS-253-APC-2B TaxID=2725305 RepID=UPI0019823D79
DLSLYADFGHKNTPKVVFPTLGVRVTVEFSTADFSAIKTFLIMVSFCVLPSTQLALQKGFDHYEKSKE